MEGPEHRRWMYLRRECRKEYMDGVDRFDEFARMQDKYNGRLGYRCPCVKCKNKKILKSETVRTHLYQKGFMARYWYWTCHGEVEPRAFEHDKIDGTSYEMDEETEDLNNNYMEAMVNDAMDANEVHVGENPTASAQNFYDMLNCSQQPLYEGCDMTELEMAVRLLSIKSDHNISHKCLNEVIRLLMDVLPPNSRLPKNLSALMKKVRELGLEVKHIDCCPKGCMLYYKDNEMLDECKFCGHARRRPLANKNGRRKVGAAYAKMQYLPLIPRLQRLYASKNTANHMRWHKEQYHQEGILRHPCDGQAWKHFDTTFPDFAIEPRNVRLGLCADGFTPFLNNAKPYSVWPIVVTPYNLPPSMCMTTPYMFLTCMIPGPKSPTNNIDVYMEPLIDELKLLWDEGVETYDISSSTNFRMRAALMWTINDFPAYGMLSGWSTHGKLACPVCMHQNQATQLAHGRKPSWFDCHRCFLPHRHGFRYNKKYFRKNVVVKNNPPVRLSGEEIWATVQNFPKVTTHDNIVIPGFKENHHNWTKQSIFWELSYWKSHLLRHNLDVMHIEKNFCDNITNTVMDVNKKTKDNPKARMDMALMCDRNELNLVSINGKTLKPRAKFVLSPQQRKACCEWLKGIRLPDGYCSNIGNCVDSTCSKLQNMKSHDNHVFLETLLPIAFSALPEEVLAPLVELSEYFKNLCSSELHESTLADMIRNIPLIICKLERFFPPGFWNVMEHLPIHLAEEAMLGGPVHYRWMYPFERFFGWLKAKATQKTHPEVTMVNSYLQFEITKFATFYFDKSVPCMRTRMARNQVQKNNEHGSNVRTLSVFETKGTPFSLTKKKRYLNQKELNSLHLHVLLNCQEVEPYLEHFKHQLLEANPNISDDIVAASINKDFSNWFKHEVEHNPRNEEPIRTYLIHLSHGPVNVTPYSGYKVDGLRYHTEKRSEGKKTYNCGVLVKGVVEGEDDTEYYGVIQEILCVEYVGEPIKRCVLFLCDWFNPNVPVGVRYPPLCPFAEVNHKNTYANFDPFILADNTSQVVYLKYPDHVPNKVDWWVAVPNKSRGNPNTEDIIPLAFQEDYMTSMVVDALADTTLLDNSLPPDEVDVTIGGELDDAEEEEEEIIKDGHEEEEEWEENDEDTDDEQATSYAKTNDNDDDEDVDDVDGDESS